MGCVLKRKYLAFVAIVLKCHHGQVGWITELFSLVGLSLNLDHCIFFCLYNMDCLSKLQVNSSWIPGELQVDLRWTPDIVFCTWFTWTPPGVHLESIRTWYNDLAAPPPGKNWPGLQVNSGEPPRVQWSPPELQWGTKPFKCLLKLDCFLNNSGTA